jgi:pyruvate/2-oxoglutarate dehydrogenase complex dihydrolipoamide acyltransferase (E2) component
MTAKNFIVEPFPPSRHAIVNAGRIAVRRHISHALIEIDVTKARRFIHEHKAKTGESLSFTAFLIACLAHAIDENKHMHAYRNWRNQLVLFDEVDVSTLIETKVGHVALPHVIRAANRKTFREIHQEIRTVQATPAKSKQKSWLLDMAPYVPALGHEVFYWLLFKNPHWLKQIAGTVIVTSVGMFGKGTGWGFGFLPMHTLGITVGGIAEKPGVVEGRIEIREYLCITVSMDHDIIDGAPAARFVRQLKELVESGYGLE